MKPRRGATRAQCRAQVKLLVKRWPVLGAETHRLGEVLMSWAVNDNHAAEIVGEILLRDRMPDAILIRNTAERLKARGPRRCSRCNGTGFLVTERNGASGAEPCDCRRPQPDQGVLFGGAR